MLNMRVGSWPDLAFSVARVATVQKGRSQTWEPANLEDLPQKGHWNESFSEIIGYIPQVGMLCCNGGDCTFDYLDLGWPVPFSILVPRQRLRRSRAGVRPLATELGWLWLKRRSMGAAGGAHVRSDRGPVRDEVSICL
jgi:hypothetical protein